MVIKYHVGEIYGNNADEEIGHFDDKMYLYVNPDPSAEPASADITLIDANAKDIYRWGTTRVFGSARGLYLRSADQGSIPPYTMDGIRVGRTWEEVMGEAQGVDNLNCSTTIYKSIENGQLIINKNNKRYSSLGAEL